MRILVFLHGTTLMDATAVGYPREERVKPSRRRKPSILDDANNTPIVDAVTKMRRWHERGATIVPCSSQRKPEHGSL